VGGEVQAGAGADGARRGGVSRRREGSAGCSDLERDPGEFVNRIGEVDGDQILARQRDLLAWYASQIEYVEAEFPR
jgi:hypothetical protein